MPAVAQVLTSSTKQNARRMLFRGKELLLLQAKHYGVLYYGLGDPFSPIYLQYLLQCGLFDSREFKIEIHLVDQSALLFSCDWKTWYNWARQDAEAIGQRVGLKAHTVEFPRELNLPGLVDAWLAQDLPVRGHGVIFARRLLSLHQEFLQKGAPKVKPDEQGCASSRNGTQSRIVVEGQTAKLLRGHYQCGNLYVEGEWYYGLDRLPFLMQRYGISQKPWVTVDLPQSVPSGKLYPQLFHKTEDQQNYLEMYYSFRSPYSYLAIEAVRRHCVQTGLLLRLRPVLPMVMRNLAVPPNKKFYLLADAARVARWQHQEFGKICDAVGLATEQCMAIFFALEAHNEYRVKSFEWIEIAAAAIWAHGQDLEKRSVLRKLLRQIEVDESLVDAALADENWRQQAEQNRLALTSLGLWGVPSFALYKDGKLQRAFWGQDRIWMLP